MAKVVNTDTRRADLFHSMILHSTFKQAIFEVKYQQRERC